MVKKLSRPASREDHPDGVKTWGIDRHPANCEQADVLALTGSFDCRGDILGFGCDRVKGILHTIQHPHKWKKVNQLWSNLLHTPGGASDRRSRTNPRNLQDQVQQEGRP